MIKDLSNNEISIVSGGINPVLNGIYSGALGFVLGGLFCHQVSLFLTGHSVVWESPPPQKVLPEQGQNNVRRTITLPKLATIVFCIFSAGMFVAASQDL